MRMAELAMGVVMGVFSLYLMWKSAELPIGWIPGEGPGGGAWPFWLSTGMLLCCIAIVIRWARRMTPQSRSEDVYMDSRAFKLFLLNAGALAAMIGLFHIVGAYGAIPAFLIFYLRFMGGHSWRLT
ncbi:MAG: tripartite tricarboxylate transporter TctB family protein, partial [Proteobacteria bacterium]|nr:tripartite tricarboxylate transporter TctB family protein [Pseudomonadota bacterium]